MTKLVSLYNIIDQENSVFSLLLDFKKAIDCVDHHLLLSRLELYGIRGLPLDWLNLYLPNRSQYVSINGTSSRILLEIAPIGISIGAESIGKVELQSKFDLD